MLRRALDFWMEPPASYSPIIAKETSFSVSNDSNKESDNKFSRELTVVRNHNKTSICWFYLPQFQLSLQFFFSVRGAENFHLYLWLFKDLAWAQSWYYSGHIFGFLAISWSVYILCHAVAEGNTNEVFTGVAQMLWLTANVWWMSGDLHDHEFPNRPPLYEIRTTESGHMMQFALCWLGVYYIIVKPFKLFGCDSPEALRHYDNTGLKPRFSILFKTWREYENCHILFWLGKDCAWNGLIPSMWIIFVVPTILIALDFVHTSLYADKLLIDHAHYFSQALWVLANAVWAGGELFDQRYDTPYPLIDSSPEAYVTLRWYSSWMLIIACIPVLTLYGLWSYYTYKGLIHNTVEHEGDPGPTHWSDSGPTGPAVRNNSHHHADQNNSLSEFGDSDCVHDSSTYHVEPTIRNPMSIDYSGPYNGSIDMTGKKNEDVTEIYLSNFHQKSNDTDEDMEEGKMEYVRTDDKQNKKHSNTNGDHKNGFYGRRNEYLTTDSDNVNLQNAGQKGPSLGLNSPSLGQDRAPYQIIDDVTPPIQSLLRGRESSSNDYSKSNDGVPGRGKERGRGRGLIGGNVSSKIDYQLQVVQKCYIGQNNNDVEYIENPMSSSYLSAPLLESDYCDEEVTHIAPNLILNLNSDLNLNTIKLKRTETENGEEFEIMEL